MEQLKIAQFYNKSEPRRKKSEILETVDINYCVSDTYPGKKVIRRWAGYTSLHFAVKKNDLDFTTELLRRGADVIKQDTEDGCTPLHVAMYNNYSYKKYGSQEYKSIEAQEITYHLINILLSEQVKINNIINPKCKNGISHLHIACLVNHVEAVQLFVKANESLSQPLSRKAEYLAGYTPLHCAIESSSVEAAAILLRHGADIHDKNAKGMSCVHLLVKRIMDLSDFIKMGKRTLCMPYEEEIDRLESIIKLVLKARANDEIFINDNELSAFHLACILREKSIVEHFLKKSENVNMPVKSDTKFWPAWMPLHFASYSNIQVMILLMENGANIMMRNLEGETPLDLCAKRFTPADIRLILLKEDTLKDIVLSDNYTKLSDLMLVMNDFDLFSSFVKKSKNINVIIPLTSPVWSGYNLLHLCVSLNEKSEVLEDSQKKTNLAKTTESIVKLYNCTEEEEALYNKRIELCLKHGCRASMKNSIGQTPIHLAFNKNRQSAAEKLLSCNKDNVVDQKGLSHLHIACALGQVDTVKRYLSTGAEVNSRISVSFDCHARDAISVRANSTPLHLAVMFGQNDVVECLLKSNADVYAQDSLGFTSIHLAESKSLAQLLFNATPKLRDSVSTVGLSHLHVAAWANDDKAVDKLLLNGAEVDRVVEANVEDLPFLARFAGKTALLLASSDKVVKSLLKVGANVHAKDSKGVSALQHAMRSMSNEPVGPFMRLLRSGKLDIESCGMTMLHAACGDCNQKWAKNLLKKGADVNAKISDKGNVFRNATPLHTLLYNAYMMGFDCQELVDFVEILVDEGADLNSECQGSTPLHLIYEFEYWDVIEDDDYGGESKFFCHVTDLFLKSFELYDVNPVNNQGFSHFHFACLRNDVETATKFLDHGVDINAWTDPFADYNGGFTALHFAMAYRCKEVAYLLLERGADVNAEDAKGNRPLHVAIKRKFVDLPLIEAMLSRGADIHAKNMSEETLLSCLWKYGGLTLETLEFFWNHGGFLNIVDTMNAFDK